MANILGFEPPVYVNPVVGLQMAVNIRADRIVFQVVAMICAAGRQPQDCTPERGYSRDVAIVGEVPNEIMCNIRAQWALGGIASFQNLAPGEFIKTMCVRKDDAGDVARSALLHRTSCRIPIDGSQGPYDPTTVATLRETTTKHSASCP
jgi:hypothetical protein